jgi:3-oxoacyl-[acyl-carrier-protein] synthase II
LSRRVVITGIGLVSSLGIGTEANWKALLIGTSGVGRVTKFDVTGYAAQIAAEVQGFDPLDFVEKKDVKKMDVFIQYAIAASQFAMDDSKLAITASNAPDVGVFIGSGIGGFQTIEREHSALLNGGPRKISPFLPRYGYARPPSSRTQVEDPWIPIFRDQRGHMPCRFLQIVN